ncbi:hypothetical protein PUN4_330020 [Paraburkholderia unamae]|nr:hypothetical protein PUN4_330020 [Paraburkholderia unamae]
MARRCHAAGTIVETRFGMDDRRSSKTRRKRAMRVEHAEQRRRVGGEGGDIVYNLAFAQYSSIVCQESAGVSSCPRPSNRAR